MLILIDVVVCFPLLYVHSLHWSILFYSVFSIVIRAFGCIGRYYFIVCFPLLYVHSLHWSILFYSVFSIVIRAFGCIGRCFYSVFSIVIHAFGWNGRYYFILCFPLLYVHSSPLLHYRQYGTGGVLNEYSLHSYMNRIDKGGGDDIIIRVTQ